MPTDTTSKEKNVKLDMTSNGRKADYNKRLKRKNIEGDKTKRRRGQNVEKEKASTGNIVEWKKRRIEQNVTFRQYLPFYVMSMSAFITFDIISVRHYFPFENLSNSAFFNFDWGPFVIIPIRHFVFSMFYTIQRFFVNLLYHSTFCPSTRCFLLRRFVVNLLVFSQTNKPVTVTGWQTALATIYRESIEVFYFV